MATVCHFGDTWPGSVSSSGLHQQTCTAMALLGLQSESDGERDKDKHRDGLIILIAGKSEISCIRLGVTFKRQSQGVMLWLKWKHNTNQMDLKTALELIHLSLPPLIQTSQQQQLSHHLYNSYKCASNKSCLDVETKPQANHQSMVSMVQTTNQTGILNTLNNFTQLDPPGNRLQLWLLQRQHGLFLGPEKEESLDYK